VIDKETIQRNPDLVEGIKEISVKRSRTISVKANKGVPLTRPLDKMSQKVGKAKKKK